MKILLLIYLFFLANNICYSINISWFNYGAGRIIPRYELAISENGQFVLSLVEITNEEYDESWNWQVWDVLNKEKVAEKPAVKPNIGDSLAFDISPDGSLVTYCFDSNYFEIWDWEKNEIISGGAVKGKIREMRFMNSNNKIIINHSLTNHPGFTFSIFNISERKFEKEIKIPIDTEKYYVNNFTFDISDDNQFLVCSYNFKTGKAYNQKNHLIIFNLNDYSIKSKDILTNNFNDLCISPDGTYTALISKLNSMDHYGIAIINNYSGELYDSLNIDKFWVSDIAFDKNSDYLKIYSNGYGIKYYSLEETKIINSFEFNEWSYAAKLLRTDSIITYSYSNMNLISIFNNEPRLVSHSTDYYGQGHSGNILAVDISPDNIFCASGSYDNKIKIRNNQTGQITKEISNPFSSAYDLKFSPDGTYLAIGYTGPSSKLEIINTDDFSIEKSFKQFSSTIADISWSPDGSKLALFVANDSVYIYNLIDDKKEISFFPNDINQTVLSFSNNGKWLAIGNKGSELKIFDLETNKIIFENKMYSNNTYRGVINIDFSENDNYLLASYGDFKARLYQTDKWEIIKEYSKFNKAVLVDNNYIIADFGTVISLINFDTGEVIKKIDFQDNFYGNDTYFNRIVDFEISKDKTFLIAGTSFGDVLRVNIDEANSVDHQTEVLKRSHFYAAPATPNPAYSRVRSKIYWDTKFDVANAPVYVCNVLGKKIGANNLSIYNIQDSSAEISWDCTGVSPGVYFIVIQYLGTSRAIPVVVGN